MDKLSTLRRYGLFDAKVPRYTSFPPANRFAAGFGARMQSEWLSKVAQDRPVSIYVHIPFCRRLCWFCACRTQGTQTLGPVAAYVGQLLQEIDTVAAHHLKPGLRMQRLHLGGGTPTLLSAKLMSRLLDCLFEHFKPTQDFEFSVEIDPTEAHPDVLEVLAERQMTRASLGVQDFAPEVQKAIGREQGYALTRDVIGALRRGRVKSLNIDLLYGLPYQTAGTLLQTLDHVLTLRPDRLALYGYAHVPHVSKRQVMIPAAALPNAEDRLTMSELARAHLIKRGYAALGIDHFALPEDNLTQAARAGTLSRNFQGYTDDPCDTLLGFGASAISKFPQGYLQNAVATSAYHQRIDANGLAAHKGIGLDDEDRFTACLIESIMCKGEITLNDLPDLIPDQANRLQAIVQKLMLAFPELLVRDSTTVAIRPEYVAATRLIAAQLDLSAQQTHIHSLAV